MARTTANVSALMREPDSEQRANQLLNVGRPYRIEAQADPARPLLNVYTQAPTPAEARALADASVVALREQLAERALAQHIPPRYQLRLEQLGRARGAVVNGGTEPQIAVLTFLVAFGLSFAMLVLARVLQEGFSGRAAPAAARRAAAARRSRPCAAATGRARRGCCRG